MDVETQPIKVFANFRLDTDAKMLWHDELPVAMPLKELELLSWLVLNHGRLVTKEELVTKLWAESFVEESNLPRHIYLLRQTLKSFWNDTLIETVPRRGYRFVGKVIDHDPDELLFERRSITRTVIEELERSDAPGLVTRRNDFKGTRKFMVPVLATVLILLLFGGFELWRGRHDTAAAGHFKSIAVLPFRTVTQADKSRHDGLGLADDLITRLSNIRQINVRPTSAVARFEDSDADSTEIGRVLEVDSILEGTVYRVGDKVRVTMRLVNVAGNNPVWSGEFERTGDDKMLLMDEIAIRAVDALALNLSDLEKAAVHKRFTDDDEAYQLYQKGRFEWNKRSWQSQIDAERFFRNSIDRDPQFALAYVGLADRLATESDPGEAYRVIEKALEIDPNLGEAHATLGFLKMFHKWDWGGAESEFKRSIELDPGYATAHHWYGTLLAILGRKAEAEAEFQRALEINPLSYNFLGDLGQAYYFDRDFDKAKEYSRKAIEVYPDFVFAHEYLAAIYLQTGEWDAAVDENLKAEKLNLTFVNSTTEQRQKLENSIANDQKTYQQYGIKGLFAARVVPSTQNPGDAYSNAKIYAVLGDKEKALNNLDAAFTGRSAFGMPFVRADPVFDILHDEPRFQEILRKMDLAK